jgi:hypothetical protein
MSHYEFTSRFASLYEKAVALYRKGQRGAETFFDREEASWLAANGIASQNLYDYAEDEVGSAEPGLYHALTIETVRRDFFLNVQKGVPSKAVLDEQGMPAKAASVEGIEWLPRIIPKAKAKLRGELPASLMYCCGGDRRFFKGNNILPAEFLSLIWRNGDNDAATVAWVVARSKSAK